MFNNPCYFFVYYFPLTFNYPIYYINTLYCYVIVIIVIMIVFFVVVIIVANSECRVWKLLAGKTLMICIMGNVFYSHNIL